MSIDWENSNMVVKKMHEVSTKPFDVELGDRLKSFPKLLSKGSATAPQVSGPAAAALISAAFSCFLLMVNQHFTTVFKAWNDIVWDIGAWIPGTRNPDPFYGEIGSYTGKETIMLLGWLISWVILHLLLKNQQIKSNTIITVLMVLLVSATIMNWHPIFPYLPLAPA